MFLREGYYMSRVLKQEKLSLRKRHRLQLFFLKNLVEHAYAHNTFYSRFYKKHGFHPRDIECLGDVEHIPIVTRKEVIRNFESIVDKKRIEGYKLIETSGTTGSPLKAYLDSEALDYVNCIFTRTLRNQGYNPLRKLGFYWYRKERNSVVTRLGINRKAIIYPHSTPSKQLALIRKHNLKDLYYFPFKLYELANNVEPTVLRNLGMKRIFTVGEMLTPKMKAFFEKRFGCPVTDNYGLTEFNLAAYQKQGEQHYTVNHDAVLFETHIADDEYLPSNARRAVLTNLYNYVTPFIRYDTDDYVEADNSGVKRILGRESDFIGSGKKRAYLGDLVDAMLEFSDVVSLFSFSLRGKHLITHIVPKQSYVKNHETALILAVKALLPKGFSVKVKREKSIVFKDRGKLPLLARGKN